MAFSSIVGGMALFTTESLATLRKRVDLIEVLQSHVEIKRAGAAYKALCPFHDEKTPSFTIQKGDHHYHCFGCGAHGDAIQFLVDYVKMSFTEAVESLAQRFGVVLDIVEDARENKGPSRAVLKEVLLQASRLYHFFLLHTQEGHEALRYLYDRGMSLDFIERFGLGLAPRQAGIFSQAMRAKGFSDELMVITGLMRERDGGHSREFFYDRITFPIHDATGAVIGFSARKYREETFGGKYVNSYETPLFKKSRVLYGLHESRRRIAKEGKAIIVEGQVDALSLIYAGLNMTVAALGTAFGEGHVGELVGLGVKRVFLSMDADKAGIEAARKVGDLFQRCGVEVSVVRLPAGSDPDSLIRTEGIEGFIKLLESAQDYLNFLVEVGSAEADVRSPAAKTQLLQRICEQVRQWNNPVMVHESLRRIAHLLQVPEEMVTTSQFSSNLYLIKKSASAGLLDIDPDRILETDLLRWLLVSGSKSMEYYIFVRKNLAIEDLKVDICRALFATVEALALKGESWNLLTLATQTEEPRVQELFNEITSKRINKERGEQHLREAIQKILDRNWMQRCEDLRMRIQSGQCSDDEALALLKEFDTLKKNPPTLEE